MGDLTTIFQDILDLFGVGGSTQTPGIGGTGSSTLPTVDPILPTGGNPPVHNPTWQEILDAIIHPKVGVETKVGVTPFVGFSIGALLFWLLFIRK